MNKPTFTRKQITLAVLAMLGASMAAQQAHAGAGWADNVDKAGVPFKQATFYANSPNGVQTDHAPNPTTGLETPGALRDTGAALRKFVDNLPLVQGYVTNQTLLNANPVGPTGRKIPMAIKEVPSVPGAKSVSYPDADFYEIAVVEYRERLHSDLPVRGTTLRGYVQILTPQLRLQGVTGTALTYLDGTAIRDNLGNAVFAVGDGPHNLGPIINSQSGTAVRIKFDNYLPTGRFDPITKTRGGDVFIPTDTTMGGSGLGPNGAVDPAHPQPVEMYSQNRTMIHLHGGDTPWISDGEPHSWITPANDLGTPYKVGATMQNVPDMADPGPGAQTYYFPNNQSARMMWYHDHSYSATRINVYAGIVSAFMLHDRTEAVMKGDITTSLTAAEQAYANVLPADDIPLVFEDKTFVPKDVSIQDSRWNTDAWGQYGDLWFPHVYETNQNPNSIDGTNPSGRWDYGPWFWPVFPAPLALPTGDYGDASGVQESFSDTPLINGIAYPNLNVDPKAYRFRLLNASGQRYLNLGLYVAEPLSVAVLNAGLGYNPLSPPAVTITAPVGGTGAATAVVTVDATGAISGITVTSRTVEFSGNPTITIAAPGAGGVQATAIGSAFTEVPMVPAAQALANSPAFAAAGKTPWGINTFDGRPGGLPDPAAIGPDIIHIGTEGGFLAQTNVISSTPVSYQQLRRIVTVLNVLDHGLYVGPAERADFVIDFSQFKGKTLIVYNDSPAPNPGFDTRVDYYSGDPDQTGSGGADSTMPGYGPNTRTIMRINVSNSAAAAAFDVARLTAALPAAFAASQDRPIIPESWQNPAYGANYGDSLARIYAGSTQQPTFGYDSGGQQTVIGFNIDSAGAGYKKPPIVTLNGPLDLVATPNAVQGTAVAVLDTLGARVISINVISAGGPYLATPVVTLTTAAGDSGIGASATATTTATKQVLVSNKGIQELFESNYGRMNATFSSELPYTSVLTQTTIPLGYIDPPTESIGDGETQFWKVTHNGVDTHVVHFHLFNVQIVNRVGWDGTVIALDPAEFGWKETVKMNPLEDIYVAVRPKSPKAPFGVPKSVRLLDPTQPLGAIAGFSQVDPATGLATTVVNQMHNFEWEYIWHCHILGHEENDFMRVISFKFGEQLPAQLALPAIDPVNNVVSWTDPTPPGLASTLGNKQNEIGFVVQRSDKIDSNNAPIFAVLPANVPQSAAQGSTNPAGMLDPAIGTVVAANVTSWSDPLPMLVGTRYRVIGFNGAGYGQPSVSAGFPGTVSAFTGQTGVFSLAKSGFAVVLNWTTSSPPAAFKITRTGGIDASGTALNPITWTVAGTATTFTDTSAPQSSLFTYTIQGVDAKGALAPTSLIQVSTGWAPAPTVGVKAGDFTATVNAASVTLAWPAPLNFAGNGASPYVTAYNIVRIGGGQTVAFQTQQVLNPLSGVITPAATTLTDSTAASGTAYTYTVQAVNGPNVGAVGAFSTVQTSTGFSMPPVLGGPAVVANSANQVTVTWAAPTPGIAYTGYQVVRTVNGVSTTLKFNGLATSFVDTGLTQNTVYNYAVVWVNGTAIGSATVPGASVTTLYAAAGAVASLSAAPNATATGVMLNWVDTGFVTSYTVSRCLQSALNSNCDPTNAATVFSKIATVTAPTATFTDNAVTAGSAYTYQVTAYNGPVNLSVAASVTVIAALAPATPTFTANPVVVAGQISVTWVANAATAPAGFGPTKGYQVQRSSDNGVTWAAVFTTTSRTTVTFADTTVVAGSTYLYRVVAVETVGSATLLSVASAAKTVVYAAQATPVMGATTFGGTAAAPTVVLHWTETANTGPAVRSFNIYRDGALLGTAAANATSYTDSTAALGSTHIYQVSATNLVGSSVATAALTAQLTTQTVPVAVSVVQNTAVQATVTWSEAASAGSPPITGFQVWASINGATPVQMGANAAAAATSANVTTVAGNSYLFSVRAVNLIGSSASSNTLAVSDIAQAAPALATAYTINSPTSTTLSWTETPIAANPAVTGYNVYNGATKLNGNTPVTATTYAATTAVGTTYSFTVKAVNLAGESAASNAVSVANTVQAVPVQAAATFASPTSTRLTWTETGNAGPALTGFNVYGGTTLLTAAPLAANVTSYAATTAAGTTYTFTVKAVNAIGLSAASNTITVANTVPATVATPVFGASTLNAGVGSTTDTVSITWNPVANAANAQPVTGYVVEYSTSSSFATITASQNAAASVTGTQTTTFTAVARGTASPTASTALAYFRVRAVNNVGSSTSATRTVTTAQLK